MASAVLEQLSTYGPDRCEQLSYEQAVDYTHRLVRSQYENFTVVSWLLPKRLRDDFAPVYAFCRWADDLGDEVGDPQESLALLAWWRRELAACYDGQPRHPVFVALQPTIQKHDIPVKPFDDLITAFEQDQTLDRYQTWDQVTDYCRLSADPVGRLVLYLCGYRDSKRQELSDATCTALQLINHWQDVRRDILERNRIYVPAEDLAREGLDHQQLIDHVRAVRPLSQEQMAGYRRTIQSLLERTWPLFQNGRALWPMIDRDIRTSIKLFGLGGESIMKKVKAIDYDTLDRRPRLGKMGKMVLMFRALMGKAMGMVG